MHSNIKTLAALKELGKTISDETLQQARADVKPSDPVMHLFSSVSYLYPSSQRFSDFWKLFLIQILRSLKLLASIIAMVLALIESLPAR